MAQRKTASRGESGTKHGTGCLVWLVMLLVTLLLFVFSWDKIKSTLASTGFIDAVGSRPPATAPAAPAHGDGSLAPEQPTQTKPAPQDAPKPVAPKPAAPAPASPATTTTTTTTGPAATTTKPQPSPKDAPATSPAPKASPMDVVKSTRVAVLYFVRVDDDGVISRHEVKRTVDESDSPMTDALNALMAGPDADELARGFISLIPSDARLLSAQVRGSTAYLNFNEAFMYNRYGIEGYAGQLKQIVYTATGFPTVKDVQILIDGQTRDYLGGDGVFIGKPLSRASF